MLHGQLQWNMLNDNNEHRHKDTIDHPNRQKVWKCKCKCKGEPIYSDEEGSTSRLGLEDVE